MLPDIGASELMVIALVALIFVGPKDLPVMLKKLGQFTSKMRRMAADFRTSFDDMARQSELEDLRREVEQMRANATQAIGDPIGVDAALSDTIHEVDSALADAPSFTYDAGEPGVEDAPMAPAPKKASARKSSAAKAATTPRAKAPVSAKPRVSPAAKLPAKPRRRAPSKIVT